MTDQGNARICEVLCAELGVEPGEEWVLGGTKYIVRPSNGFIYFEHEKDDWWREDDIETYAFLIDHKDRIIRSPPFTPEEVADAKTIRRIWPDGEVKFKRDIDGRCALIQIQGCCHGCLSLGKVELFPSLRPGQSVMLAEIVGGDG